MSHDASTVAGGDLEEDPIIWEATQRKAFSFYLIPFAGSQEPKERRELIERIMLLASRQQTKLQPTLASGRCRTARPCSGRYCFRAGKKRSGWGRALRRLELSFSRTVALCSRIARNRSLPNQRRVLLQLARPVLAPNYSPHARAHGCRPCRLFLTCSSLQRRPHLLSSFSRAAMHVQSSRYRVHRSCPSIDVFRLAWQRVLQLQKAGRSGA